MSLADLVLSRADPDLDDAALSAELSRLRQLRSAAQAAPRPEPRPEPRPASAARPVSATATRPVAPQQCRGGGENDGFSYGFLIDFHGFPWFFHRFLIDFL